MEKPQGGDLTIQGRNVHVVTLAELVDPRRTAVLVIDVQNDFCHPEGAQAKQGMPINQMVEVVPRIARFVDQAREHGVPAIFIRNGLGPETTSQAFRNKKQSSGGTRVCLEGSWGAQLCGVAPAEGEPLVVKFRYDAFIGTNLELLLRNRGIDTVIMTGVTTNTCVETTARHAFVIDFNVVFLSDCTATHSFEQHKATLAIIDQNFGFVRTSQDVVAAWETLAPDVEARPAALVA